MRLYGAHGQSDLVRDLEVAETFRRELGDAQLLGRQCLAILAPPTPPTRRRKFLANPFDEWMRLTLLRNMQPFVQHRTGSGHVTPTSQVCAIGNERVDSAQ